MRPRLAPVTFLASLAVLAMATPAHAAFPGANGKIAFSSGGIEAINPDGTGEAAITVGCDGDAAWSADGQKIVFIDTPGIFPPKRRLDRAMVTSAWSGMDDADIAAVLIDAKRGLDEEANAILDRLVTVGRTEILLINKVDLVEKPALLEIARAANARARFAKTFMISALTGDGVADVKRWLAEHVPEGPWHYAADQITDAPLRQLAAEITREKLYLRLHQELPYQSMVETDTWKELKDGSTRIEQTIYVERESQRKIVLGKGGHTIRAIGADARREIADMIEGPVHLFLFVKVREHWSEDPERYRGMGLEFPDD